MGIKKRYAARAFLQAGCCVAMLTLSICGCNFGGVGDSGHPQRLVDDRLDAKKEHPPAALNLLRADWKFEKISAQETPEGWMLNSEGSGAMMSLEKELDASNYTTLFIEMKTEAGGKCTFAWESEQAMTIESMGVLPSTKHPLLNGSNFQEYNIRLSGYTGEIWAGNIQRLIFTPTDIFGQVEIRRMELRYEPEYAMRRMEIQGVVRETLFGQQTPWKVHVPEKGVLETHLGFHKKAYAESFHGTAEARIVVEDSAGKQKLMFSRRLSPFLVEEHKDWIPVRVDLSDYAGDDVMIHLEVNPLGITLGDWVYWGSPTVFSMAPKPEATPVILISIDTLRADHMSVYGYERDTTPKLAAWAKEEAVVFETAITPQSWTLPAHMSMLTGLIPPHHKASSTRNLDESIVTLPERLRSAGYTCAGFTGHNWWLLGYRGFAQGFDVYNTPVAVMRHIYDTDVLLQAWLDGHPMRNQFLFFHTYDVHSKLQIQSMPWTKTIHNPYDSGDLEFRVFSKDLNFPYAFKGNGASNVRGHDILVAYNNGDITFKPEEHELAKALYDDSIRMVDQTVFEIFESLKLRGLYDQSLIIVTADHGEKLGEHGEYAHSNVYEPEVRVPLIVRFPNHEHAGERFDKMVSTVSIYPTILDVLGLDSPYAMDGTSLKKIINGVDSPPEFVFVGWQNSQDGKYMKDYKGVRTQDWKLRWSFNNGDPKFDLFDVHEKPLEITNRLQDQPEITKKLGEYLREYLITQNGWHVYMKNRATYGNMNVRLRSTGKIVEALFSHNNSFFASMSLEDDGSVLVPVQNNDLMHLILRMEPPDSKIEIVSSAVFPYSFLINDTERRIEGEVSERFTPGDVGAAQPAGVLDPTKSLLSVWFEPTANAGGADMIPSAEMEESLKALGYLQ